MTDHFRCTVTCWVRGKHHHYENECHKKKGISDNLKAESASGQSGGKSKSKGGGKAKGKGNNGQKKHSGGVEYLSNYDLIVVLGQGALSSSLNGSWLVSRARTR